MQYIEIYNEHIIDLLRGKEKLKEARIVNDKDGKMKIEGVEILQIDNMKQAMCYYRKGSLVRKQC